MYCQVTASHFREWNMSLQSHLLIFFFFLFPDYCFCPGRKKIQSYSATKSQWLPAFEPKGKKGAMFPGGHATDRHSCGLAFGLVAANCGGAAVIPPFFSDCKLEPSTYCICIYKSKIRRDFSLEQLPLLTGKETSLPPRRDFLPKFPFKNRTL